MSNYTLYTINGTAITFKGDNNSYLPYRVMAAKSHAFVSSTLSMTPEEAVEKAEKLASENPGEKFMVFGPIMEVGSDIPIKKTSFLKTLIEKIGG